MRSSPTPSDRVNRSSARKFSLLRMLRRFARRQNGATVIEFAAIIGPFVAWMFAIIEMALIFFAGQVLEAATADSARLIMTGQAQKQSFDKTAFKQDVCSHLKAMFTCSGVHIDVRTYTSFDAVELSKPTYDEEEGKLDTSEFNEFKPGKQGDIVVVRVVYEWPTFVRGFLGLDYSSLPNGNHLLMATAAFRNEPYSN